RSSTACCGWRSKVRVVRIRLALRSRTPDFEGAPRLSPNPGGRIAHPQRVRKLTRTGAWLAALVAGLAAFAAPALADWVHVDDLPSTEVFSVWSNDDTLAVGMFSSVFVSTDAGLSWRGSTEPVAGTTTIQAVWIRNGRLYAGTFGQ